jgi:hypothetical protein
VLVAEAEGVGPMIAEREKIAQEENFAKSWQPLTLPASAKMD